MAKLPISKIRVRSRYRKNLGDIESLAASIKELGLLHPIVVRPEGRMLLSGSVNFIIWIDIRDPDCQPRIRLFPNLGVPIRLPAVESKGITTLKPKAYCGAAAISCLPG